MYKIIKYINTTQIEVICYTSTLHSAIDIKGTMKRLGTEIDIERVKEVIKDERTKD